MPGDGGGAGGVVHHGIAGEREGARHDEGPRRRVTFARQFAVGKFAVTFDEWGACVAEGGLQRLQAGGSKAGAAASGRVINVNWHDAKAYVAWLSRRPARAIAC